jgi:hypothetical protein
MLKLHNTQHRYERRPRRNTGAFTCRLSGSNSQLLKPEQLDQLVAPIALYPDSLLAEVLMALAYPTDIVQAERWLEFHKNLKGDQLKAAVAKQDWDDSIKSFTSERIVADIVWLGRLGLESPLASVVIDNRWNG